MNRKFYSSSAVIGLTAISPAWAHAEGASPPALPQATTVSPVEETAHPGQSIETNYAEAVIAYNSREYGKVLQLLTGLLKAQPNHVEALELQALSLKTQGDDRKSLEAYQKLLRLKPEKERGPYYFEAGVIYYRNKKYEEARPCFEHALALKFNPGPANFFLGNIAFQAQDTRSAEVYFNRVLVSASQEANEELKVAAHYYLGLIQFQNGYGAGATQQLIAARDGARQLPASPVARDIADAATRALAPYDSVQWFGNLSLVTQYDGNVSLQATSASDAASTGKSSAKTNFAAGFGRMSSPMDPWQWVTSYRANYNKNFNSQLKDYEFFSNVPALYLTRNALAVTSWGLKAEGNYTFRNTLSASGSGSTFRPYTASVDVGPYLRSAILPRWTGTAELSLRPQTFQQDPDSGSSRRSGTAITARLSAKRDSLSRLFNPEGSLGIELNRSQGTDYRSRTFDFTLSNGMRLGARDTVTLSADAALATYPETAPSRSDKTYSLRVSWIRTITPIWSLVGDAGYVKNASNVDTYAYTKPSFSFGLSYTL